MEENCSSILKNFGVISENLILESMEISSDRFSLVMVDFENLIKFIRNSSILSTSSASPAAA